MFCNNCGSKLDGSTRFCTNCGSPVASAPAEAPKPVVPRFSPAPDLADDTFRPRRSAPAESPARPSAPVPVYSSPAKHAAAPEPVYTAPEKPAEPAPVYTAPVKPAEPESMYTAPVKPAAPVYPTEAPTAAEPVWPAAPAMAEPPRREAPAAIKTPPVMAPAPKKTKKSGPKLGLILILLIIAAVVCVVVWGFVDGWLPDLFSGSQSSKDDEEVAHPDWEEYKLKGLTFYLPEEFDQDDKDSDYMYFESEDMKVTVRYYDDLEDIFGEDISDGEEFAEVVARNTDVSSDTSVESEDGENNGVYYKETVYDGEDYVVAGYYVGGGDGWIISVSAEDVESTDDMIEYATSGEVKKSSADSDADEDRDENQDADDRVSGQAAAAPSDSSDSVKSDGYYVECNGMRFRLDSSFEESYSEVTYAGYYNDVMNVDISSGSMDDMDEDIDNSREFAEYYAEGMDNVEFGKQNGITYITVLEDGYDSGEVVGFYVEGDTGWLIRIQAVDYYSYEDQIIDIATSGKLN